MSNPQILPTLDPPARNMRTTLGTDTTIAIPIIPPATPPRSIGRYRIRPSARPRRQIGGKGRGTTGETGKAREGSCA
eukprot:scaffold105710_cov50-Cyclotella_meneghiniana.AAC.2